MLRTLQEQDRAPTPDEQVQLSRWSSWGAVPGVFDEHDTRYEQERAAIRPLLSDDEWDAAARTTINAHYTQPSYAAAMWTTLTDLGFKGGTVLEPGCGAGTFIGLAPASARMIGVELDPTTAAIAADDAANAATDRPRRTRTGKASRATTTASGASQAGMNPNPSQSAGASARDPAVTTTHRTSVAATPMFAVRSMKILL